MMSQCISGQSAQSSQSVQSVGPTAPSVEPLGLFVSNDGSLGFMPMVDIVHPVSGSRFLGKQPPSPSVPFTLSDFGDPGGIIPNISGSADPDFVAHMLDSDSVAVNNIFVQPPHPPSDIGECTVNTVFCNEQPPVVNSTLDPSVPSFCPRAATDTVVPANLCEVTMASEPDGFNVPEHLQELFQQTLERSQLTLQNQQHLADVLLRNSDVFAKDSLDIGFCPILSLL